MSDPAGAYSLFAPKGLAEYKAGKPLAQAIHETALSLFSKYSADTGGLSTEPGSLVDLFSFALAIELARAGRTLERADGERFDRPYYMLADFEGEYGLRPAAGDTLHARTAALADAKTLPRGNARAELEQALRDTLGDDFIGLHVASGAEVVNWPTALGDAPMLLAAADIPRKIVTLPNAISTGLGSPQLVVYVPVDPVSTDAQPQTLAVGDMLVVGAENLGAAEVVEVLAVTRADEDSGDFLLRATFQNAHEPGAICAAMPFPAWGSSQRFLLVALSAAGAIDPEVRRKADERLRRVLPGVTTWALCPMSGADTIGPWTLDDPLLGRLDINPMDTITVL